MDKQEVETKLKKIASLRKQGDAMLKLNKHDLATGMWRQALGNVDSLIGLLDPRDFEDRAEVLGVRAGLLKRLGDDEAAWNSYREGADIEANEKLGSTYNRMNAVRTALLLNHTTIEDSEPHLNDIARVLEERLRKPEHSSEGWSWADLGDVYTLLGKTAEAEKNYRAYARIAGLEELRITREALDLLLRRTTESGDPDADRVRAGLEALARATTH